MHCSAPCSKEGCPGASFARSRSVSRTSRHEFGAAFAFGTHLKRGSALEAGLPIAWRSAVERAPGGHPLEALPGGSPHLGGPLGGGFFHARVGVGGPLAGGPLPGGPLGGGGGSGKGAGSMAKLC